MKYSSIVERQIKGTFTSRFLLELLQNSGYFAIVNILLESILESPIEYLQEPDLYSIILAVSIQAFFLTKHNAVKNKFFGNLIAPTIYTFFEVIFEGGGFFQSLHHQAYWLFSLLIACTQYLMSQQYFVKIKPAMIFIYNIIKSLLIYVMYMILESAIEQNAVEQNAIDWFRFIFDDQAHLFLLLGTLFLGIAIGITEVLREKYLSLLKKTSSELKLYSEWLFGKKLLEKIAIDPGVLKLKKVERVVLFMDIRGFTKWSECHTAEEVVEMLKKYFSISEQILDAHDAIKLKFTGDEVLAIFIEADLALKAALKLRRAINELLTPFSLGVGIGINKGILMEGVIGAKNIRHYDVIGDTVNTGKRIEGNAALNEILISDGMLENMQQKGFSAGEKRHVVVKGKSEPLCLVPIFDYKKKDSEKKEAG